MAIVLNAKKREDLTKAATNAVRKAGLIPAVVYGKGKEPVTVSVDEVELMKTIRDEGRNAIISLAVEGGAKEDVMLHDYQTHPLKENMVHADFFVVDMAEELDVQVLVRLEGEAIGDKEGGILQQPAMELTVRAKPAEIPEEIVVDVTELNIGDSISVADLPEHPTYELLDDEETVIVSILPPETEAEAEAAAVADAAAASEESVEPELVGAEKEDEEA